MHSEGSSRSKKRWLEPRGRRLEEQVYGFVRAVRKTQGQHDTGKKKVGEGR